MNQLKNISASIHQRLLNKAVAEQRPFNELLQNYANERFLYRLSQSHYKDVLILKGALAFLAWDTPLSRPTRDIDFLGQTENSIENVIKIVRVICRQSDELDGMVFDPGSVKGEIIQESADYQGIRISFLGFLGNARIHMRLDVGFGDIVTPPPKELMIPAILEQVNGPCVWAYPPETVVAEKFQALVSLGQVNSRMKDFYDLWLIASIVEFDYGLLKDAIKNTFHQRNTPLPQRAPSTFSIEFAEQKQQQWMIFLRKNRIDNIPTNLIDVIQAISTFLSPLIISSVVKYTTWLPAKGWVG